MRILMLSWEYPPYVAGGMGRHVAELSPALVQQGAEVHIVTFQPNHQDLPATVENGVMVHRIFAPGVRTGNGDIYQRALEANKVMEAYLYHLPQTFGPFNLIHTHDWLTSFAARAIQKAWGCPLVATIHATERGRNLGHLNHQLNRLIDQAERELSHAAQRLIVCSRPMLNEVQHFFQTPAGKVDIVPNGINHTAFRNGYHQEALAAFQQKFAQPNDLIVFTISRLVYEKGVHRLIEAIPQVLAKHPQARLIIAGTGPEADSLKRQAKTLGVSNRVDFVGLIPDEDRNRLYRIARCAVFPSLYEPFGIVALEAMAAGCPVVVSKVGGFSETVTHTVTGLTVYPDNADSVAWGISSLLSQPELAQSCATKAYQTVQELFNWPRLAALTFNNTYRRV